VTIEEIRDDREYVIPLDSYVQLTASGQPTLVWGSQDNITDAGNDFNSSHSAVTV